MSKKKKKEKEIINSSFNVYKKYYLRALILEIFARNEPLDNGEIWKWLFHEVRKTKEMYHSVSPPEIKNEYSYLQKMGYFQPVMGHGKIALSDIGLRALHECVWENLASNAFFGYKSLSISYKALKISIIACFVTSCAVLASVASFVVALCN